MNKKFLGDIGLLFVTIVWGTGFVATEIALDSATTLQTMTLRFLMASCLLAILYHKSFKRLNKSILIKGITLGVFLFLAFYFQTEGLVYTTPTKNAFITTTNIVFVPFISFFLFKGKIDKFSIIGALLAFCGVSLLTIDFTGLGGSGFNYGDFLTLLCAITFAMQIILTSRYSKDTKEPILLTIIQLSTCTIISLLALIFFEGISVTNITTNSMFAIVYLALFSTALGFCMQTVCQMLTTETKAVIVMSFEAVFGAFFSVLLLGEVLTPQMLLGAGIMFIAVMVSQIPDFDFKPKKAKSNI
ncbi:MAG: DMT family transporter [Lachnospirales bacterium]